MRSSDVGAADGSGASRLWSSLALAVALLFAASPLLAQAGQITGEVTNANTGSPLVGVQIAVEGTGIGTLTNNTGRFLIRDVPGGTQTLTFTFIGYAPVSREVVVQPGGTAVVDAELRPEAIALEGVVVTGTAGAARQREIGNSVATVDASELENVVVTQVSDVLQGRAVGVTVTQNSGALGSGSSIRLRGNNSVTFSNEPLIYVDGVRLGNEFYRDDPETNQSPSPLDDINPNDIERIEVVRGAAATTLYGTEAAGGVIQIFTKKGAEGAPAWQFGMEQGVAWMPWIGPDEDLDPTGLHLRDCTDDPSCPDDGSWFKPGHMQRYNLSVRGGGENMNYFLSGRFALEDGVVDTPKCVPNPPQSDGCEEWFGDDEMSGLSNVSLRGNFGFNPSDNLTIQFNSSYSHRSINWVPDGNNAEGFLLNVTRGLAGYTTQDVDGLLLLMDVQQDVDHFITGVNFLWNPLPGVDQRLNIGLDHNTDEFREERPWLYYYEPTGDREVDQVTRQNLTFDYSGSWRTGFAFGEHDLSSSFSWGAQLYDKRRWGQNGFAYEWAGPGEKVLDNGTRSDAYEYRSRITSGGFFFQEQVGWQDRLFLTGGVRFDGFSTFGEGFGLATYPKAQLSYLISDHTFWPEWWNTMKLRAAVGESGKAPGAFDAERIWEASSGDEQQPGVIIDNVGNPELGPEVTREVEAGFDAAMLDDRLAITFTWYNQKTYDAILAVTELPSNGIAESTLRNVGEFENRGFELSADFEALRTDDIFWTLGAHYANNTTKVIDLGGLDDIYIGWRQRARPCRDTDDPDTPWDETSECPMPGFWNEVVTNGDQVGVEPNMEFQYIGPVWAPHTFGFNTSLTVFDRLTFDFLAEGQAGHYVSAGMAYQNTRREEWPPCFEIQEQIEAGNTSNLSTYDWALCDDDYTTYGMWTQKADFLKIRSASLAYRVPDRWLPLNMRGVTLRVAGRNLATFTDWPGLDPETYEDGGGGTLYRQEYYNMPPTRSIIFGATVNF
jgi:TonB-dependent SusC/RagA subfamily outer membrane receptor